MCALLNRLRKLRPVTLLLGGLQYEYRNDLGNCSDCVPTWWRRLVLGSRPRLKRPISDPESLLSGRSRVLAVTNGRKPGWRYGSSLQPSRAYESVQSGLWLLAQTMQLPHHRTRHAATQHSCGLDCGGEFPYDWSQMKMLASKPRTGWAAAPPTIVPAL